MATRLASQTVQKCPHRKESWRLLSSLFHYPVFPVFDHFSLRILPAQHPPARVLNLSRMRKWNENWVTSETERSHLFQRAWGQTTLWLFSVHSPLCIGIGRVHSWNRDCHSSSLPIALQTSEVRSMPCSRLDPLPNVRTTKNWVSFVRLNPSLVRILRG